MTIKTKPHDGDVEAFLAAVPNERRRNDGRALVELMREVTGVEPQLWGPTMIGFGAEPYTNSLGTNDWFIVGCSPRAAALTVYGIWDAYHPDPRFAGLGPHTTGKSCVYVKRLDALDSGLLRTLLGEAWERGQAQAQRRIS